MGAAPRRPELQRPDEFWGTDAARFWTKAEGWCWFFAAVDHCVSDVVGWHVAKKGDRRTALEGVRTHMGGFAKAVALGLGLRHDCGSQYRARQFQAEIKWLGIRSSPAYVGEPECNGVAERFIRTLKEECIYLHDSETLEEARTVIGAFIERYNTGWLLQRHGYLTPAHAREREARPKGGLILMLNPSSCPGNPNRYTGYLAFFTLALFLFGITLLPSAVRDGSRRSDGLDHGDAAGVVRA